MWLSSNPKSIPGQEIRRIVSTLHLIQSKQELSYWLLELADWSARHHEFVHEKTVNPITGKYWYKHKLLRRSFSVILSALPNLFHYLENPKIPKSTNGFESFLGQSLLYIRTHFSFEKDYAAFIILKKTI